MKSLLMLCLSLSLCACASFESAPPSDTDHAKVAAIEHAAQRAGVRVIWINMPRKAPRAGS